MELMLGVSPRKGRAVDGTHPAAERKPGDSIAVATDRLAPVGDVAIDGI
jgi:hypothetical protein